MASEHGLQVETLPVALLLSAIASLPCRLGAELGGDQQARLMGTWR